MCRAVSNTAAPNSLRFPFNQRALMAIWGLLYNPNRRFEPVADRSPNWNRGAYLVESLGHCGDCHTPRNVLQALNNRKKFGGGMAEGWRAYNLSSDTASGIGSWSPQEMQQYPRYRTLDEPWLGIRADGPSGAFEFPESDRIGFGRNHGICAQCAPVASPDLPAPKLAKSSAYPGADKTADDPLTTGTASVCRYLQRMPFLDRRQRLHTIRDLDRNTGRQRPHRNQCSPGRIAWRQPLASIRCNRHHACIRVCMDG